MCLRCSRAQSGIQGVSSGQRSVAFVFTLLTFCLRAWGRYICVPRFGSARLDRRTWPPGPELREKVSSTACLGMSFILKLSIQVRASALWAASWMTGIGGGMGRPSRPE